MVLLGSAKEPAPSTPSIRELGSLKLSGQYQWYKLGSQLGVEQHVLERIEENYPRDSEIRQYKMFGEWLRRGHRGQLGQAVWSTTDCWRRQAGQAHCFSSWYMSNKIIIMLF